ncbi:MAG: PBP1A family penicillin-binding protein [Bdellovibrionales bacterium]|nr:PBP1A family penicillin-binding protein [Bdellovibrionales bacterium]
MRKFLYIVTFLFLLCALVSSVALVWGYYYITRDLPKLDRVEDYRPPAVTQVVSRDGELIAEFFDADNRRYPVSIDKIPPYVRNAFLAAEDAQFYSHPGIDIISIVRAAVKNLQAGSARQGGSTITQQVVKNLLLSSQKKLERKLKEAILSYQLEQRLTKDEILQIYLNQIFFGNRSYGIQAAARAYFRKNVEELSIAEGALLAGMPKAPSRYSPLLNPDEAYGRQHYVLGQMVEAGFITQNQADAAKKEKLTFYSFLPHTIVDAPYYATEVRRKFEERFPSLPLDTGGYRVEAAVDVEATRVAQAALNRGIEEVDRRRGWRGPLEHVAGGDLSAFFAAYQSPPFEEWEPHTKYPAMVRQVADKSVAVVLSDGTEASVALSGTAWANRLRDAEDKVKSIQLAKHLRVGDIIEVSLSESKEGDEKKPPLLFDQTPNLQGALVLLEPSSGEVRVVIGGYDFSKNQYNRVTQSFRQPGSSFKPVVYLAAIDQFGYTPASIVYDEKRTFKIGDQYWNPGNFDETFLGPITLRTALEKSRNLVSADIISRIGVEWVINYARKLGIESPLGTNLSLSLGSSEVTPLEITRAYGVFANKGVLMPSIFILRVLDRDGTVIYSATDTQVEKATRVISEQTAFIMANLMKGVVERGTGWRIRELGRPAAGKTGTSNDLMDAWYVGYTPNWVCGVWVGFDLKKTIGPQETGGRVSAPIWLSFMKSFLEREEQKQHAALVELRKKESEELGIEYVEPESPEPADFVPPEGVVARWVSKVTGHPTAPDAPDALLDYFIEGTEPEVVQQLEDTTNYLDSPEL